MGKLTCHCLNVKIFVKSTDLKPTDLTDLGITNCESEFFSKPLANVLLALEGVRIEQPCLVSKEMDGHWQVHKCGACDMFTHAEQPDHPSNSVLVSCHLVANSEEQEKIAKSVGFSQLYKIVLPSPNDNQPEGPVDVQSDLYEVVSQALKSIQERLNSFLDVESAAMQERIRSYKVQQESAYSEVQSKARNEKNAMISLVRCLGKKNFYNPSARHARSPVHKNAPEPEVTTATTTTTSNKKIFQPASDYSFNRKASKMSTDSAATKVSRQQQSTVLDDFNDAVFAMDELELENSPLGSSEDDNDTDDSSNVTGRRRRQEEPSRNIYSSSMPIAVPSWNTGAANRHSSIEEDEDEERAPAPEQMGDRFQALARSVHNDNSVLWDRPTRKISAFQKEKF